MANLFVSFNNGNGSSRGGGVVVVDVDDGGGVVVAINCDVVVVVVILLATPVVVIAAALSTPMVPPEHRWSCSPYVPVHAYLMVSGGGHVHALQTAVPNTNVFPLHDWER
jgi:hypothetical protein